MSRTLAIDLGSRRVGLALRDEGGKFATPYNVLTVNSADDALAPIRDLIARESVQRLVVGLPLNMDDSLGPAARSVIAWSRKLTESVRIPMVFVDERLIDQAKLPRAAPIAPAQVATRLDRNA